MPLVGKTMAEGHTHRMAVLCRSWEVPSGRYLTEPAHSRQSRRRHRSARLWKSIGKLISFPLKSRDLKPCSSVRKLVVPWTWSSWDWAAGEWAYPGCWRIWQDGILKPTGKTSNAGGNFRVPVTVRPCEWLPVVYQPERMTVENIGTPPADILSLSPSGPGMETVIWNHWY